MVYVKVCGVTGVSDAEACVLAGATAIGVNFVPASPRRVEVAVARSIARAIGRSALVVGVVADLDVAEMLRLREDAELGCLQLHGDEPASSLVSLLPHAYKAVRIGDAADVARARGFPGEHLLVDAKSPRALGGTGESLDWDLVVALARERKLTLAGGLTPENVAEAVARVRPYCVDVASGVESRPGVKDIARVRAFIAALRG